MYKGVVPRFAFVFMGNLALRSHRHSWECPVHRESGNLTMQRRYTNQVVEEYLNLVVGERLTNWVVQSRSRKMVSY